MRLSNGSLYPKRTRGDLVFAEETFDFLERVDACETRADITRTLHDAICKIGFYTVLMCWLDHERPFEEAQIQVIGPHEEFARQYVKRHYFRYSPVVRHMRNTRVPFRRSEVKYDPVSDPMAHRIMQESQEAGLAEAWVVPIHADTGLIGFVAADNERKAVAHDKMRQFHVMCLWAHSRARHLPRGDEAHRVRLTPREREVVSWLARGKTADEIARLLGLSPRTVEYHIANAGQKLNTKNRTHTVVEALKLNQIPLYWSGT